MRPQKPKQSQAKTTSSLLGPLKLVFSEGGNGASGFDKQLAAFTKIVRVAPVRLDVLVVVRIQAEKIRVTRHECGPGIRHHAFWLFSCSHLRANLPRERAGHSAAR
jgi:hypothetical protein